MKNKKIIDIEEWDALYKRLTQNLEPYEHYDMGYEDALNCIDDWIDSLPIVDNMVKVVRCKDCKYSRKRNKDEARYLVEGVLICTNCESAVDGWNPVFPEHFCYYGEHN